MKRPSGYIQVRYCVRIIKKENEANEDNKLEQDKNKIKTSKVYIRINGQQLRGGMRNKD